MSKEPIPSRFRMDQCILMSEFDIDMIQWYGFRLHDAANF